MKKTKYRKFIDTDQYCSIESINDVDLVELLSHYYFEIVWNGWEMISILISKKNHSNT